MVFVHVVHSCAVIYLEVHRITISVIFSDEVNFDI